MLYQEVAIAESPQHTDTGQSGIGGSLDINIAITHIDGFTVPYPEFTQGSKYGIGGGFLADALRLINSKLT